MKTEKHPGTWNKGYPKAQETKAKAGKWNSIKLKSFRKLSSVWRKKKKNYEWERSCRLYPEEGVNEYEELVRTPTSLIAK